MQMAAGLADRWYPLFIRRNRKEKLEGKRENALSTHKKTMRYYMTVGDLRISRGGIPGARVL
jgi:hypothetical protein